MGTRSIFHETWWLDIVTGGDWKELAVEKGGKVLATLPYQFRPRWTPGARWSGSYCGIPPLTRVLPPVVLSDSQKTESINRSNALLIGELIAQIPNADHVRFVMGPTDAGDAVAWQFHGFATRVLYTYIIETEFFDPIKELRDTTRRTIRRAQEILRIEPMGAEAFSEYYGRNIGNDKPYFDLDLITPLQKECIKRNTGTTVAAIDAQGKVHAAIFFIWDDTDYYYFLPSRDTEGAHVGATAMLVLYGIQMAKEKGLRFDFDGITTEERARFMVNFGGTLAHRTIVEKTSAFFQARRALQNLKPMLTGRGAKPLMYLR